MPQNNNGNNGFDLDALNERLTQLNGHLENLMLALERNGKSRIASPVSLYSPLTRHKSGYKYNTKSFEQLTRREINKFIGKPFEKVFKNYNDLIKQNKKILNDSRTTTAEYNRAKRELEKAKKAKREAQKQQRERLKNVEKIYNENDEFSDKSINERWANLSATDKKKYKNKKGRYIKSEKKRGKYTRRAERFKIASETIAKSGLGGTKIGRAAQSAIAKASTYNDIKGFANNVANGGAKTVANSIVGTGKSVPAKAANGGVEGLTKAAGGLGGPLEILSMVLSGVLVIFKLWGKVVAAVAEYKQKITNSEIDLINAQNDFRVETLQANANAMMRTIQLQGQMQMKQMEVAGQNMLGAFKVVTEQYAKSHEIAASFMFKGIQESVYEALSSSVDAAGEIRKYEVERGQRGIALGAAKSTIGTQMAAAGAEREATIGTSTANYKYNVALAKDKQIRAREEHYGAKYAANSDLFVSDALKQSESAAGDAKKKVSNLSAANDFADQLSEMNTQTAATYDAAEALKEIQDARGANLKLAGTEYTRSAGLKYKKMSINARLAADAAAVNQELTEKKASIEAERKKIAIDAAIRIKKAWIEYAKNIEKFTYDFDKKTNDVGINLGFTTSNTLVDYKKSMFATVRDVARHWGKDLDAFVLAQTKYAEQTGRNKVFGEKDYNAIMAGNLIAGDEITVTRFASMLELFNTGVAEGVEMLLNYSNQANRSGLNARKYMKEATDALELAQKYSFKDGIKGIMRMAKWAMNMRFNIKDVASMLDTVRDGGLEGVITQASKLHVLGGNISLYADFMGMFHDAWAEGDSYAKRVADMTRGYGTINRKTGQTTFNINENWVLSQMASGVNMPLEDLLNIIRARNKRDTLMYQFKDKSWSQDWDEDTLDSIINAASFNRSKNRWEVMVKTKTGKKAINGDDIVEYNKIGVNEFNPETDEIIQPEAFETRIEEYLEGIVTRLDRMYGEEIGEKCDVALQTYNDALLEAHERIKKTMDEYNENRNTYIKNVTDTMQEATTEWEGYFENWIAGNESVDTEMENIGIRAKNINSAVGSLQSVVDGLRDKLSNFFYYIYNDMEATYDGFEQSNPSSVRTGVTQYSYTYFGTNMYEIYFEVGDGDVEYDVVGANPNRIVTWLDQMAVEQKAFKSWWSTHNWREIFAAVADAYKRDKSQILEKVSSAEAKRRYLKENPAWENAQEIKSNYESKLAEIRNVNDSTIGVDAKSPFSKLFDDIIPQIGEIKQQVEGNDLLPLMFIDKKEYLNELIENVDTTALKIGGDLKFKTPDGKYINVVNFLNKDHQSMRIMKNAVLKTMS